MLVTIKVAARDEAAIVKRRAGAQSVLKAAEFEHLPDLKLLAFFDGQDAGCFKEAYGLDNRGVFFPGTVGTRGWPDYLTRLLSAQNPNPSLDCHDLLVYFFDGFIYLHESTCDEPTALVMTFAHELQHFSQFGHNRHLWAANTLLQNLPGIETSEIPIEREARIVAKHVAERLCGADQVHEYILRKIADSTRPEDINDWGWIRGNSSTSYDLKRETELAFQQQVGQRGELERRLQERGGDPSFQDVDLSLYFPIDAEVVQDPKNV